MEKEITIFGHVNGKGILSIYNRDEFIKSISEFFKGRNVQMTFTDKFYEFSDKHRGYYFGVLVRQIQSAWLSTGIKKSMSKIDAEMREMFLYYEELNESTGLFEKHIHTLKKGDTSVSVTMMKDFVEQCIIWTAQNLNWAVPYPSEVFTESDMTEHQQNTKGIGVNDKSTI